MNFFGTFGELVNAVIVIAQHIGDRLQVMLESALADVEDRLLRFIHHIIHSGRFVIRDGRDFIRGGDHLAADGVTFHNATVRFRVKR